MLSNWKRPLGWGLSLGLAAFLASLGQAAPTMPQIGAVNYVEGQASVDNQTLTSKSVGSIALNAGDVISTGNGRAEVLLTPGVFLRVGKDSAVRMVAPELANTRVELLHGQAMVEADYMHKEDRILIAERGAQTQIDKKGIYDFDANAGDVRVFDGKATVTDGDRQTDVKKGKVLYFDQPNLKAQKFDQDQAKAGDPLYAWSKLRSEYLADATAATAQTYIVDGGGWYGPGWYWNPWWDMYSFVPGDGFFYNPFGWGLYSPVFFAYNAPYYGGYGGFYGVHRGGFAHGAVGHGNWAYRGHVGGGHLGGGRAVAPTMRGTGGFRGGMGGVRSMGGGFHGGMGGVRSMGGGFHGGHR